MENSNAKNKVVHDSQAQLASLLRPKKIEDFAGNEAVFSIVKDNLSKSRFPHAVIFYGRNGIGKSSVTEYIGLSLVCDNHKQIGSYRSKSINGDGQLIKLIDPNPCGVCSICENAYKTSYNTSHIKKNDMTVIKDKTEVSDIIKDMFVYSSAGGRTVFILEEFQVCKPEAQKTFLEWLTKIPDDVYVLICTDTITDVIPAIRSRCVELCLEGLTLKEGVDFFYKTVDTLGLSRPSKEVAKSFVKASNKNPRKIVNNLDLFRENDSITKESVHALFKINEDILDEMWFKMFDKEVSSFDYSAYIIEVSESRDMVKVYNDFKNLMLTNLIVCSETIEDEELTTVDKGRIRSCIKGRESEYSKVIEILEKVPSNADDACSILIRAKISLIVNSTTEKQRVSVERIRSNETGSFTDRYKTK